VRRGDAGRVPAVSPAEGQILTRRTGTLLVVACALGMGAPGWAADGIKTPKDVQKRLDQERDRSRQEGFVPADPWKGKTRPEDYAACLDRIQKHHGKLIGDAMERRMWAKHRKKKLTPEERAQWKQTIAMLRTVAFTGPDTEPISILDELGEEELRKIAGKISDYASRIGSDCRAR
jgi:hypothetical protein